MASEEGQVTRTRQGPLLLALTCAAGTFALMQAVIVPALPVVQRELGTSTEWVAWTVSIYLLSASVATPLLGRLGDQFGKDRMLIVTLAIFTVGLGRRRSSPGTSGR